MLEREQLKHLLTELEPNPASDAAEPDDKILDELMHLATTADTTGDGQADTCGVSRAAITAVLQKYHRCARRGLKPSPYRR